MEKKQKEYHIGIDYGTSNSCVGIFINGTVQIAPNRLGERTTPSIVSFTEENKAIVGEETISQKLENAKNIIYEVKRFIGLSYEEFQKKDFAKNLNYEVVNIDNVPKIKINLNGTDYFYTAVEISSLIIKKMVQNAEDFINEMHQGVKINKAVLTVPAHFNTHQTDAVKAAANMAGIEVARIIYEPTAAAIAYGLGQNLIAEDKNNIMNKKTNDLYTSFGPGDCDAPSPLVMMKNGSSELVIVFDLGGGTLDVTLLNIKKNHEGHIDFEVLATDGDIHLGGSDFDNKIIDFCINEFCNVTGHKEEEIRKDKQACKRLKIKCENSKKLLSIMNETVINIDNFYGQEDLIIPFNRFKFEEICKDLYQEIEKILYSTIKNNEKTKSQIDEVILVGGATRMPGIKNFLGSIFGPMKIKSTINPDEAVAYGATLDRAKMEENAKINFNLQDIIAYNLGIEIQNNEMSVIIPRYSKIPCSKDKNYQVELTKEKPFLDVDIYEGNSKSIKDKDSLKLGEIKIDNINKLGECKYNVNFTVDVNSKLTVKIKSESFGIEEVKEIKNITHAVVDRTSKKIKIIKTKDLTPLVSINSILASSLNKLNESTTDSEKIKNLNNCIQVQEDKVNNYVMFLVDNETAYEYVYNSTKELFDFYVDMFKYKKKEKEELSYYIKKIKEFMKNLIKAIGFMEELLGTLNKLRNLGCENEFYEIFTNFIELLNNEALDKKKNKNYSRYYCKLYFERVFYDTRKYISEYDINNMDEKIKQKYIEQKKIAEDELKKANSFTNFIEQKLKTGEFPYGKTGYTILGQKIDKFEQDINSLSLEEFQEVLDIYENMAASFDKTKYSLGELYCLGNIIYINNQVFKRGYQKLWRVINRFETILQYKDYNEQEWIGDIKELIEQIKLKKSMK